MARWEQLEQYLYEHDRLHTEFTVYEYAEAENVDVAVASSHIQSYLSAQRQRPRRTRDGRIVGGSKTLYVLQRVPGTRTRNTHWSVGTRAKDAKAIGRGLSNDVLARAERAFQPDLLRLREINPRQARRVERQIKSVLNGAMVILEQAAQGMADEDDE